MVEECNNLEIGDWKFDVFTTDEGNLGFTVYNPKDPKRYVDIFVDKDHMEVAFD